MSDASITDLVLSIAFTFAAANMIPVEWHLRQRRNTLPYTILISILLIQLLSTLSLTFGATVSVAEIGTRIESSQGPVTIELDQNVSEPMRVVIHTDLSLGLDAYGYDCHGDGCGSCFHARDVDDGWAIPFLLTDPSIDVVAILVHFGDAFCYDPCSESCDPDVPCENIDQMVGLAKRMVAWSGKDVPVFNGSHCPFDADRPTPEGTREVLDLLRSDGPALVMGIGNAVDSAYMIRDLAETDEIHLIDQLVLEMGMWGRWYGKSSFVLDGRPVGDANVLNDQGSIKWLIAQPKLPPVVFVPFNAVRMGLVTPELLDAMVVGDLPVSRMIGTESRDWLNHWHDEFNDARIHLWDVVTMLSLLEGSDFAEHQVSPSMRRFTNEKGRDYLTLQLADSVKVTGFTCKPLIRGFGPPLIAMHVDVSNTESCANNTITQLALLGINRLDDLASGAAGSIDDGDINDGDIDD